MNKYIEIYCPACHGRGVLKKQECRTCEGAGMMFWTGNSVLFWGRIIDMAHIYQRRLTHFIQNTIDFLLIVFGIAGMILFIVEALSLNIHTLSDFKNIFFRESAFLFVFWITVLTDSYVFYRFMKRVEQKQSFPHDIFSPLPDAASVPSWDKLLGKNTKKIEISKYFSDDLLQIVENAYVLGRKHYLCALTPVHLFISLLGTNQMLLIFLRLGVPFHALKEKLARALQEQYTAGSLIPFFTPEFHESLVRAFLRAHFLQKKKVECADLLLASFETSEILQEILYDFTIDRKKIINVVLWLDFEKELRKRQKNLSSRAALRPKSGMNKAYTSVATPFLNQFCEDLTFLAKLGVIEPCIGREKEIKNIFEILSSGARHNVVLVAEPGIGKRTIINGIAARMAADDVPDFFKDKRLVNLSIAKVVSGVSPADAQMTLLHCLEEAMRSGNIILSIHDISGLVGITSGGRGSIDLAGTLSEVISKKQILVIATATPKEYTEYIENSHTLGTVLEKVNIHEVEGDQAIQILEAQSALIEYKYGLIFTYDAIEKSYEMCGRYMHERYLPEKAVEVLKEAAGKIYAEKGKGAFVTGDDIADVISIKTEIPLTKISQNETQKLLHLEEKIHERMIDQEEAVTMAAGALRRARAQIRDTKRPIVNLLFLGPTGVGKTQLAKTLADVYFGSENKMIRLDMSEYQEKSSVNKLIGTQGDTQGYLTEQVRHHPFSLVLLDEIEKAHPDILNIFLQVMDDGRLTDGQGRTIDFTSVFLICTSNACTSFIQKRISEGYTPKHIKKEILNNELQKYFRPEFLNRFDGIVVFKPLSRDDILAIAKLLIEGISKELEAKGIRLEVSEEALKELSYEGYDPVFGARGMRRVLQEKVDDVIANYILSKKVGRRDTLHIGAQGKIDIIKSKKW